MRESGENYLETIFVMQNEGRSVRAVDIAEELTYSKASVSRALHILEKAGYLTICANGIIELSESGRKKASSIYERHIYLTEYFTEKLGLDSATADADACRIEHIISDKLFNAIKSLLKE